jgi:hypothetical protein
LADELEDSWLGPFSNSVHIFKERNKADLRQTLLLILIEATWKGGKYPNELLVGLYNLTEPNPENDDARTFLRRNDAVLIKGVPLRQWFLELEKRMPRSVIDAPRHNSNLNPVSD